MGGAKSTTALVDNTIDNLFADSLGTESAAGSIKYRQIYYHNAHATLTALNARVYITSNPVTPSPDDTIDIGLGTSAINGTEQTISDENTAPTGVSWSAPLNYAAGIALGDIPAGQSRAIWLRRTLNAGASAFDSNSVTIEVGIDSGA